MKIKGGNFYEKFVAILLVVSMALLLIGCGAKREGDVVLKREYTQAKDGKYEFDGRTFDYRATVETAARSLPCSRIRKT